MRTLNISIRTRYASAAVLLCAGALWGQDAAYSNVPGHYTDTIQVNARNESIRAGLQVPYETTREEVLSTAGTWGDFTRYLQVLPGVAANSDLSNEIIVRGGNPEENLYAVDGIEVPNINHFALEGNTGGFTSMIDTSAIASVNMKPNPFDPEFSSRLSSLIEIRTRGGNDRESMRQVEVGIAGAGGLLNKPFRQHGSLLLSAHRSVLNLATNDIGIDGVPIYTNGLAKIDVPLGGKDRISVLDLSGADSIIIRPNPCNAGVTSNVRTDYGGIRSTSGFVWDHFYGTKSTSAMTLSYSSETQDIGQRWQTAQVDLDWDACNSIPAQETPIYQEHTRDQVASAGYRFSIENRAWLYSIGGSARLRGYHYSVAQPLGAPSPFNTDPSWSDSDTFTSQFATGESATFGEITGRLPARSTVVAAVREEQYALTGAHSLSGQGSLALQASEHQSVNFSIGHSSQLAPVIDILSYQGNRKLDPIEANQFSIVAALWNGDRITLSLDAFEKRYSREPVSTQYLGLMLANMINTLGQQFVWLPLQSAGRGRVDGIELLVRAHSASRARFMGTSTYSRTRYSAGDGILRPGNFDFPLALNAIGTMRLHWGLELSVRDSYASGRPYTPFNIALSQQQHRGIYDLTKLNAFRAPAYNRFDVDLRREFLTRKGRIGIQGGLENALDRKNFLGYVWMTECDPQSTDTYCRKTQMVSPGVPEVRVNQMPIFPSARINYQF